VKELFDSNFSAPEGDQLLSSVALLDEAVCIGDVVARILHDLENVSEQQSLLVGISGIDGSGKGYVTRQIKSQLAQESVSVANVNIDGWLNLPDKRFSQTEPGEHFYGNAIRFEEFFRQLALPLRNNRSLSLVADFAAETATEFRKHTYTFKDVDVVLAEGIFLFKRQYRRLFDLTVWVDCSFSTALDRAIKRGQEELPPEATIKAYETIYFPAQLIHLKQDRPRESADLIINNDENLAKQI